jgi:hypothetical protein
MGRKRSEISHTFFNSDADIIGGLLPMEAQFYLQS